MIKERLRILWHRICWNAWNYARTREIAQRKLTGESPAEVESEQTPEQRRIVANEARQLLENPHFRQAFAATDAYIEAQALACDPGDKDRAAQVILAKQLLQHIRREVIRKMEDGWMAEVQIAELEKRRRLTRIVR